MKKLIGSMFVSMCLMAGMGNAFATERGTAAEAEAMVKRAAEYVKKNGRDNAFKEFSNPQGQFIDRDLYVMVYDLNGINLAHGSNAKMIGKDLIDLKDADGKPFIRERIEAAKSRGRGWQDYKWLNPTTRRIEDKATYFERHEDFVISAGIYKP